MERVNDLIDVTRKDLKVVDQKGKGAAIQDISEHFCCNEQEVYNLILKGLTQRKVCGTAMNDYSSRSHALFTLKLKVTNHSTGKIRRSKLHLVDLGGSESAGKTGCDAQRLQEAKSLNQSLSTLSRCIVALTSNNVNHIPYRESKLTKILKESFGGNSKTCIIVTVSPHPMHGMETLNTLKYGARAQKISNKVQKNENMTKE